MDIENFFKNHDMHAIDYITRHDAIGGEMYITVNMVRGKAWLSIGDGENGEIHIRTVKTDEEIRAFVKAILR